MADISRLLNEASGKAAQVAKRLEEEKKQEHFSPAEDAGKKQAKLNWLGSTITEEMFLAIGTQSKQLVDNALEYAGQASDEEGRIKVIHLLIKAKALRDIISQFTKQ